ncbi:hypothetical protein FB451DRAFT_1296632 [Mycena latifolia]|nr:hypothetical protein FB451DRAFT_1296632 [Mycena latifolia]
MWGIEMRVSALEGVSAAFRRSASECGLQRDFSATARPETACGGACPRMRSSCSRAGLAPRSSFAFFIARRSRCEARFRGSARLRTRCMGIGSGGEHGRKWGRRTLRFHPSSVVHDSARACSARCSAIQRSACGISVQPTLRIQPVVRGAKAAGED